MKTIFELKQIDTGFLLVQPEAKDSGEKLRAFHNDTVRDERMKLIASIIEMMGWKHDFKVVSRRAE